MSLIELLTSVVLLVGTLYVVGDLYRISREVQEHARRTEEAAQVRLRLRARLGEALQVGWPLDALGVAPRAAGSSEVRALEDPAPNAPQWAAPAALVCRTDAGYRAFVLRDRRLLELTLRPGGVVHAQPLVEHVIGGRLVIERDRAGAPRGVTYRLQVQAPDMPAPVALEGFVAARRERPPARHARLGFTLPEGW